MDRRLYGIALSYVSSTDVVNLDRARGLIDRVQIAIRPYDASDGMLLVCSELGAVVLQTRWSLHRRVHLRRQIAFAGCHERSLQKPARPGEGGRQWGKASPLPVFG